MILFCVVVYLCFNIANGVLSPLCPPSHPDLGAVTAESAAHMGAGTYLVAACCPIEHQPIYFGNEGVGCCQSKGQKCIFQCKCIDGTKPKSSRMPSFINEVQPDHYIPRS